MPRAVSSLRPRTSVETLDEPATGRLHRTGEAYLGVDREPCRQRRSPMLGQLWHPWMFVPEGKPRWILLSVLGIVTGWLATHFGQRELENDASPSGIVSFQLAGNEAAVRKMLAHWKTEGR